MTLRALLFAVLALGLVTTQVSSFLQCRMSAEECHSNDLAFSAPQSPCASMVGSDRTADPTVPSASDPIAGPPNTLHTVSAPVQILALPSHTARRGTGPPVPLRQLHCSYLI